MKALWQAHEKLPRGYRLKEKMDLAGNRRQMRAVMWLSVGLFVAAMAVGLLIAPLSSLVRRDAGIGNLAIKLAVLAGGIIVYIVGHEAVHGVCMWSLSRVKPRFGVTLMYAYAGSEVYFAKYAYVLIALMPAVVWTAVLGGLCWGSSGGLVLGDLADTGNERERRGGGFLCGLPHRPHAAGPVGSGQRNGHERVCAGRVKYRIFQLQRTSFLGRLACEGGPFA